MRKKIAVKRINLKELYKRLFVKLDRKIKKKGKKIQRKFNLFCICY